MAHRMTAQLDYSFLRYGLSTSPAWVRNSNSEHLPTRANLHNQPGLVTAEGCETEHDCTICKNLQPLGHIYADQLCGM